MSNERILSAQETWEKLGVSRATLYNMIARGDIRPHGNSVTRRRKKLEFAESEVQRVERGEPIADRVA